MAKKPTMSAVKPVVRPKARPAAMGAGKTKNMKQKKTNSPRSMGGHIGP
jgi:hypothetical protein